MNRTVRFFLLFPFKHRVWLFVFLSSFFSSHVSAQWCWQNPLPQGNSLYRATFIDQQKGWISSSGGTLLKTTDGGMNWGLVTLPRRLYGQALFFLDENHGWTGGQRQSSGVFHSLILGTTNGGTSWAVQLVDSFGDFGTITFVNQRQGWAAGQFAKIFHTSDGGASWTEQINLPYQFVYSLSFVDSLRGWGAADVLVHTSNGGETWIVDTTMTWVRDVRFINSTTGWICGEYRVARTTDGGETWHTQLDSSYLWDNLFVLDNRFCWVISGGRYIGATTNGGATWLYRETPSSVRFERIAFRDSINGIGVGLLATLYKTSDGGTTWQNVTQTATSANLNGIHFMDQERGWIAGNTGTVLKTTNSGTAWSLLNTGVTASLSDVYFPTPELGWAVGTGGTIIRTTDGGGSWVQQPTPIIRPWRGIEFRYYPIGWIVGGDILSDGRVLKTSDGGDTWFEVRPFPIPWDAGSVKFTSQLTGWILAGSSAGMYKTTDGGESWQLVLPTRADTGYTTSFFITNERGWVASNKSTLYSTTDGGILWQLVQVPSNFSSVFFSDSLQGWGGTSVFGEIYRTTTGGATWFSQFSPLGSTIRRLTFSDTKNGWAVSFTGAIIHTSNGGTTFTGEPETQRNLPRMITLDPNYPNPFNSETTISFNLQTSSRSVSIRVFDILGRLVKTLPIDLPRKGKNVVRWNGVDERGYNVSSGVYLYEIAVDEHRVSHRMMLVR